LKGAIALKKYLIALLILGAFLVASTDVWAAKTPRVPKPLINRIPNHLVSTQLEMIFTTEGGFIYDRTRGGDWVRFPNEIFYLRKNCNVSKNLALVYGYTKASVYDVGLGRWVAAPEEYSYHDSEVTTGIAGSLCDDYALVVGIEKTQVYDFTLHKWFVVHGISRPSEVGMWTTFPSQAGVVLRREKIPNDFFQSMEYQVTYKVGSGAWKEDPMKRLHVNLNCTKGQSRPRAFTEADWPCTNNSCPPWSPRYSD
jgi:hypothetical protein